MVGHDIARRSQRKRRPARRIAPAGAGSGIEYVIAVTLDSAALLFVVALAKTGLIVNYFMHVYRLWRQEEH